MAITLRSRREIDLIRKAGVVVSSVLSKLQELVKPGVSTGQLDKVAMRMTKEAGGLALFKGVECPTAKRPFPGVICASINEQLVHGIPSEKAILREGDILSVDYGVKLNGYCADSAVTVPVGRISEEKARLLDVTKGVLDLVISRARPGLKWSQIAGEMQKFAEDAGYSVVTDFVGHGIGTEMWEDPKVPNFVSEELLKDDIVLREGMVLAVEPMVNAGSSKVKTLKDGWAVATKDKKCSAHFEHTIVIVKDGCEVMTE